MTPTDAELEQAGCLFSVDVVQKSPEMTAFKREARWRQHLWGRETRQITEFGSHLRPRKSSNDPLVETPNGTKLLDVDANAGKNFLNDFIFDVAEARVRSPQPQQTLEPRRLRRDLLSSMPMAFNLFGEACLEPNEESRIALSELFGVEPGAESDIIFEWSPGRGNPMYTNDRTAFDVALRVGGPLEPATVVGIETKYHEHSMREAQPKKDPVKVERYQKQTDFLVSKADASEVFVRGWKDAILDTDLRQIWRDHLLALSMRRYTNEWTAETKYVLVYPKRNVSFADAAQRYSVQLVDGDTSFCAITIEDVLDAAFGHDSATKQMFANRYLW